MFRGPSSLLYGENAPGGLVNLVSKRPAAAPQGEVQLGYGSNNRRQIGVDVSDPLNDSGNILGRVVMLGRKSDTQADHVPDDRIYIAPSLTLNFDDFNTLTLLANYQKDHTNMEPGLPAAGTLLRNPNGQLSKDTMLGDPDWNTFERETWSTGYEFSHTFNDDWQFRQNSCRRCHAGRCGDRLSDRQPLERGSQREKSLRQGICIRLQRCRALLLG